MYDDHISMKHHVTAVVQSLDINQIDYIYIYIYIYIVFSGVFEKFCTTPEDVISKIINHDG